ncbi:MAG: NADH-quinone oxidoreductase subunit N [Aquificaceae bacterium]
MNWNAILPEIVLSVGILIIFLTDLFFDKRYYKFNMFLSGFVPLFAFLSLPLVNLPAKAFFDVFHIENTNLIGKGVLYLITSLSILSSYDYFRRKNSEYGELGYLMLVSSLGLSLLMSSDNLGLLFISLELSSVTLYILIGLFRRDYLSKEASYKYLVIGTVGTSMLAFGSVFYYASTGGLFLRTYNEDNSLFLLGLLLILSALALKVSSVPFHFWTPDAYEGAPTPITAYLSTAPKLALYFLLVNMASYFSHMKAWFVLIGFFAILSMFYASFVAYAQKSVKRLLAYSSIAHAGYFLLGLVSIDKTLSSALLFYVSVYTFAALGSFVILAVFEKRDGFSHALSDYKGIGRHDTLLASFLSLLFFAMIGIPPMALFVGKLGIFMGLLKLDLMLLAVLFLIFSLVSAGYYLRVVVYMFMESGENKWHKLHLSFGEAFTILVCILAVFILGLFPNLLYDLITKGL